MYTINESIGNFSQKVFESDNFYEIQDYLLERFENAVNNEDYENTEESEQLFYSYFNIEEKTL